MLTKTKNKTKSINCILVDSSYSVVHESWTEKQSNTE